MITTRQLKEVCGDSWVELFPIGRKIYIIIPDAIDWSKKDRRIYRALDNAVIKEIFHEDGKDYMLLSCEQFCLAERRLDDDSFLETVFLFEDEAEAALAEMEG